jgi:tetratricopeptide (TPR) repeat protein
MATLLLTTVGPAQRSGGAIWDILDSLSEADGGSTTLQEIFADIGDLLVKADRSKVKVLEARLSETEEEIRHLENLQATLQRGIVIDLPKVLRESGDVPATNEALKRERQQVDELQAQARFLEQRRKRTWKNREEGEALRALAVTPRAEAALDVVLDVPEPPKRKTATEKEIRDAIDKAAYGKALYLTGDYHGAIRAYEQVVQDERTLEIQYQMARCQEMLGQWKDAQSLYTAVSAKDPSGHWGGLARWMLDLGKRKQSIRALILSSKGKENK